MALHRYQQVLTAPISGASVVSSIFYVRAPFDGTIKRLDVWIASAVASEVVFNMRKNGVAQFSGSERPAIAIGQTTGAKTGLAIDVVRGDRITIDVDVNATGGAPSPIAFEIEVDDGISGSGETNTASNVGTSGVGVFARKNGVDLEFKKIKSGTGISVVATGNDEIEISASTASTSGWHPDEPPSSPTSYDDEFPSGALDPKWTTFSSTTPAGGKSDILTDAGALGFDFIAFNVSPWTMAHKAISQSAPVAPYKIRAKLAIMSLMIGNTGNIILGLRESSTNKCAGCGINSPNTTNKHPAIVVGNAISVNPVSWNYVINYDNAHGVAYFEIENNGTNLHYKYSNDGRNFYTMTSELISSRFTVAPDQIIISGYAQYRSLMTSVEWIRRVS